MNTTYPNRQLLGAIERSTSRLELEVTPSLAAIERLLDELDNISAEWHERPWKDDLYRRLCRMVRIAASQ